MTQTSGQTAAWYQTAHVGAVAEVSKATYMPYTRTDLLTQCYYSGRSYKLIVLQARPFSCLVPGVAGTNLAAEHMFPEST